MSKAGLAAHHVGWLGESPTYEPLVCMESSPEATKVNCTKMYQAMDSPCESEIRAQRSHPALSTATLADVWHQTSIPLQCSSNGS